MTVPDETAPPRGAVSPDGAAPADNTARTRIVDAAIELFGEAGYAATSVKKVADAAGVSAGLVIHHFRSKDGLREACDRRVVELIRAAKTEAVAAMTGRGASIPIPTRYAAPLSRYLARALIDGSPHVDELIDDMIADAEVYLEPAVDAGIMTPSANPRERLVLVTIWALGGLALHRQVRRLLGADLLDPEGDITGYLRPVMELVTQPMFAPEALARMAAMLAPETEPADAAPADVEPPTSTEPPADGPARTSHDNQEKEEP